MILAAIICSLLGCVAAVFVALRRRPSAVLPFRLDVGWTSMAGAALAVVTLAVVAWSIVVAPRTHRRPVAYGAGTTMLVVDLSGSIAAPQYATIRKTLLALGAQRNRHAGLVFFSDAAVVVLPPQTPAAELAAVARFFVKDGAPQPLRDRRAATPSSTVPPFSFDYGGVGPAGPPEVTLKANPWMDAFNGGTAIYRGLALARTRLERLQARNGQIVLISDLEDGGDPRTRSALLRIAGAGMKLRVVGLGPSDEAKKVYLQVFGPQVFVKDPTLAATAAPDRPTRTLGTRKLIPAAALVIVLIGALGCGWTPVRLQRSGL